MPDLPSDEVDSRTASLAAQRNRSNKSASVSNPSSRQTSREPPNKRQRRARKTHDAEVQDFVPKGATFSANSLEVDPETESSSGSDDSSSSGSDSDEGSDSSSDSESENEKKQTTEPKTAIPNGVASAPAPDWNKTGRSAIRTSLRSRQPAANTNANANRTDSETDAARKFEAVNDKYWRGRSSSSSPGLEKGSTKEERNGVTSATPAPEGDDEMELEEGEVNTDQEPSLSGDSDDSGSLDSEADDSIMLNTVGSRGQTRSQQDVMSISDNSDGDGYDPEALPVSQPMENGSVPDSKENALARFAQKYPTAPSVLSDLNRDDMELQAKIVFYSRDINDINLQLPIVCVECLREGHLAEVCPLRECVHCGSWNQHQSSLCPKWRRCQRCRERGHDSKGCPSALKSSASEVPCDLCGSSGHVEFDCDFLWKLPRQDTTGAPALVSISCAHCTSSHHLIGDCPSLTRPFLSSSFTVREIDPSLITNINSVVGPRRGGGPAQLGKQRGMKIRGRADYGARSPSPDSDDMMSRGGPGRRGGFGNNRNGNRGNINIRIGGNKNNGPPPPSARDYRDREDPYPRNYNSRQRSMSPPRGPPRGRGRGGYPPPGPSRGGRGGGGRGGRGGPKRGGGDAYRPLPSAAKKAWDKYRL
ncbi:hypothetical protein BDV18DRAFT_36687 [Aspergillus unguis]